MGECNYFFKAQFKTAAQAKKALPKIITFLEEIREAYNFWQGHRGIEDKDAFWEVFQTKFPLTCAYLPHACLDEGTPYLELDNNNGLSGKLDFGQHDDLENFITILGDRVIGYEAYDVWHFMDWSGLIPFFKAQFGATKVVVASEEDGINSLDSLDLFEYQEIVEALVKKAKAECKKGNTELHNALTGLHPDLNFLLNL